MITIGLSLLGHAAVLGCELIMPGWGSWTQALKPLKLVYEPEQSKESAQLAKSLGRMKEGIREVAGPVAMMPSTGSGAEGYQPQSSGGDIAALISQITVGSVVGTSGSSLAHSGSGWERAVDLTNLAEASQGNPVLFSYFGALREQIQDTANSQSWLPEGLSIPGTVYVGFVINKEGRLQSSGIVTERSADSNLLQNAALRIIKSSGSFLPLPPSFGDSSMAIIVPLEFAAQ